MKIHLASVYVDDQDKALRFYTDVLGFEKKEEFPVGEYRWLTVVSPRTSRERGFCSNPTPTRLSSRSRTR